METKIYGQNEVTGDVVSVTSGGTVAVSRGFNSTIGILGNMDTTNGSATPGEINNVPSSQNATELFGADSELDRQVRLAYGNGVYDVFATGLTENEETETFDAVQSGTLSSEVSDPTVTSHDITATDTSSGDAVEVAQSYESPPPTPDSGANVNVTTREIEFSASGTYEVSYTSEDFSSAIDPMADKNIRFMALCTENEGVLNDGLLAVNEHASTFDFKRVVGGANPRVNPQDYSDGLSDQRMVLTAPSRGYQGEAETQETRTVSAVTGKLAARPLGDTATNTTLAGFVSVHDYPDSDLATLDDAGLLTLHDDVDGINIVRDKTTSSDVRFSRVYACEIVDDFAYTSHLVAKQFIGRINLPEVRTQLEKSLQNTVYDARNQNLLDDGSVQVINDGAADEATAKIGLDVVDVLDRIFVDITVGPITRAANDEGGALANVSTGA